LYNKITDKEQNKPSLKHLKQVQMFYRTAYIYILNRKRVTRQKFA